MIEQVRGTIIGESYSGIYWTMFHNGNLAQGFTRAKNEHEAKEAAEKRKQELIKTDPYLFKGKDTWELRFYKG